MVISVALAGGMIYLNMLKTRAVPDYNAGADLAGLEQAVSVYRDSLGIPHIYADSETDLYRTVGYVMAQDRLWQMDLLRRITTGRLSEVLDPGLVQADQLFRALDFPSKSKLVLSRLDPGVIEILEAYADGINQYMDQIELSSSNQVRKPFILSSSMSGLKGLVINSSQPASLASW